MNRADRGRALLRHTADAGAFLEAVAEARFVAPLEIHAYCLLERHYHLLVRAVERGLGAALDRIEGALDQRTSGDRPARAPLFAGPWRAVPVRLGRHLAEVSRYIHLNPVVAGLAWAPETWPHSSYRGYLGDPRATRWLCTSVVLGCFGSIGARHRYRAYIHAGLDPGSRDAWGRPRWDLVRGQGPGSLLHDLAWRIDPVLDLDAPAPHAIRSGGSRVLLRSVAQAVATAFAVDPDTLRSAGRGGSAQLGLARGALVVAARSLDTYRLGEVSAWMGYASPSTAAAVAARFVRAARADPSLTERLDHALGGLPSEVHRRNPRRFSP